MVVKTLKDVTEGIKNKTILWDDEILKMVLRLDGRLDLKVLRYKEELIELAIYLNEGFIDVYLEGYEGAKQSWEELDLKSILESEHEKEVMDQIIINTSYIDTTYMKFQAWKWLQTKKPKQVEMKKVNICWYSTDLNIMAGVGNINPQHLVENLRKGIKEYAVLPYVSKGNIKPIIVFKPNKKFHELLRNEIIEEEKTKSCFLRNNNSKADMTYVGREVKKDTEYEPNDLIEFKCGGNIKRGIVLRTLLNEKDMKQAKKLYEEEKNSHSNGNMQKEFAEIQRKVGFGRKKVTYKWVGDGLFCGPALLVKHPVNRKKGLTFEFYTIPLENVFTKSRFDVESVVKVINDLIERSGIINLKVSQEEENNEGNNASYYPDTHEIKISVPNAFQLCVVRFIHEGTTPEETFNMLIAHELGHAHPKSQYLYSELFTDFVDKLNELNRTISNKWRDALSKRLEKQEVEELKKNIEELIVLLKEYKIWELKGEMDAYSNGKEFVPDNLIAIFERTSWEDYVGYKEKHCWHIKELKNSLYLITNLLDEYEKVDFSWFFNS